MFALELTHMFIQLGNGAFPSNACITQCATLKIVFFDATIAGDETDMTAASLGNDIKSSPSVLPGVSFEGRSKRGGSSVTCPTHCSL